MYSFCMSIADLSVPCRLQSNSTVFSYVCPLQDSNPGFVGTTLSFASRRHSIAECYSSTSFSQPVVIIKKTNKTNQIKNLRKALLYDTWQILTVFYHHVNHMERGPTDCKEKHHCDHHYNCSLLLPEIASRHFILNH